MAKHPLLERAASAEVRNAKGFRAVAASMTGESVAVEWAAEREAAPPRCEWTQASRRREQQAGSIGSRWEEYRSLAFV